MAEAKNPVGHHDAEDQTYDFGNSGKVTIEGVTREVPLEDGSIGLICNGGEKVIVSPGWLASSTTGPVDWE